MNRKDDMRVLFAMSGLGLGNATRQHALIEELEYQLHREGRSLEVVVCAWGRAADYFRQRPGLSLVELAPYPAGPITFLRNCYRIFRAIRRHRPSLVVLDSDYHLPAYFFLRAKIIYVGQAWNVVSSVFRNSPNWSLSTWRKFFLLELCDALYQSAFAGKVLVPSFSSQTHSHSVLFRRIPLIVRKSYRVPITSTHDRKGWAVALSGSGLDGEPLRSIAAEHGHALLGPSTEGLPISTDLPAIDRYLGVITQCGLSSLSEAIARRLPMALVPMPNHPEQYVNAFTVARLGWGKILAQDPHAAALNAVAAIGPLPASETRAMTDGAAVATQIALQLVRSEKTRARELEA